MPATSLPEKVDNPFVKAILQAKQSNEDFATVLKPIEADTFLQLAAAAQNDSYPFENSTNQVETHLAQARASLNACLELRKLAHEIEAEAVKGVWNSIVVEARTDTERRFDEALYLHRPLTVSEQYVKAEPPLPSPEQPVGQEAQPPPTPAASYKVMRDALTDRRAIAVAYEQALAERRSALGSAFNHLERHTAIRQLFTFLLVESFCRARAAAKGLKSIYQMDKQELPKPANSAESGFADRLLEWVNIHSQALESLIAEEIEFDASCWLKSGGAEGKPLGMTWGTALTSLNGVFNLTEAMFPGLQSLRIRGLRLEVLGPDNGVSCSEAFPLTIKTPTLATPLPIFAFVGNGTKHPSAVTHELRANQLYNANPIGQWTIEFRGDGKSNRGSLHTSIVDIIVHLRLAAIPSA